MAIETTVGENMASTGKKKTPAKRKRVGRRTRKVAIPGGGRTSKAVAAGAQASSGQVVKQLDVANVPHPASPPAGTAVVDKQERTARRKARRPKTVGAKRKTRKKTGKKKTKKGKK